MHTIVFTLLCATLLAFHGSDVDATFSGPVGRCESKAALRFVGQNIDTLPVLDLNSADECCKKCSEYQGKKGEMCVGYSFITSDCGNECWLKKSIVVIKVDFSSTSGLRLVQGPDGKPEPAVFPSILKVWDKFGKVISAVRMSIPLPKLPSWVTHRLPSHCSTEEFNMNMKYISPTVDPLPIFNLQCPEDCKKACYDYQVMSGRYACTAFNFKYAADVSECWLLAPAPAPFIQKPAKGYASGKSGRSGHKIGPVPKDYVEILNLYRELLADSTKCISTIGNRFPFSFLAK